MKTELLRLLFVISTLPLAAGEAPPSPQPGPAQETAAPDAAAAETAPPAAAPVSTPLPPEPGRAAERLPADTAVFAAPDPQAPVIARLKAGTSVVPLDGDAPAGWRRVELAGPFEAFARSRDITKGLEVRPGASILAAPREGAPVLTVAAEGDRADVTGLAGNDWVQIRLQKKLAGFVATGAVANQPASAPVRAVPSAPTRPAQAGPAAPGRPAQFAGNTADLPRTFAGQLTSAATLFHRNPPYDYQLSDANGKRIAYLDLRRVPLNARIESLVGRSVTITGTLRDTVDGKDLVIAAESLSVK